MDTRLVSSKETKDAPPMSQMSSSPSHLDEALRYFAGRLVSGVEGDRRRWSADAGKIRGRATTERTVTVGNLAFFPQAVCGGSGGLTGVHPN